MAQSETKEGAFLGIEPFRPTLEPPLRLEHWRIILKLAILAKEGISIDILREAAPNKVNFHLEPIYEENVGNNTAQSGRDRRIRNEQLKNAWLNKCLMIEAAGKVCGDRQ